MYYLGHRQLYEKEIFERLRAPFREEAKDSPEKCTLHDTERRSLYRRLRRQV